MCNLGDPMSLCHPVERTRGPARWRARESIQKKKIAQGESNVREEDRGRDRPRERATYIGEIHLWDNSVIHAQKRPIYTQKSKHSKKGLQRQSPGRKRLKGYILGIILLCTLKRDRYTRKRDLHTLKRELYTLKRDLNTLKRV